VKPISLSIFLLFGTIAFADVVTLKDGRTIPGQIESGTTGEIRIKVGDSSQAIAVEQIRSIQFDHRINLPLGTEIAVRTIDRIDSDKADTYHEYAASLDDPVVVDGVEVVPVNAKAVLKISDMHRAGITRRASLSITLVAVTINGQRVQVKTDDVDSKSGSQAKRSATGAAIGAGAGAAIGAMAGGAVGAGIGAAAGAAAGTTAAVLKGKPVKIAPETRFTYKLTQAVENQDPAGRKLPVSPASDTLTLRDGTSVTGTWIGIDADQISFPSNLRARTYERSQVSALTFGPPLAVSLGQSVDQVVKALGTPGSIDSIGAKKIYVYPNLKVTFVDGKVTDIQ